jgi:hypothetical protein
MLVLHSFRGKSTFYLSDTGGDCVVAANPDILPLEFLLGIMRDPAVSPDLRIKWRRRRLRIAILSLGAPLTIDATLEADRERIERGLARRDVLADKDLDEFRHEGAGLTSAEKAELETSEAWRDTLPAHLRGETLGEWLVPMGARAARWPLSPPGATRIPPSTAVASPSASGAPP